MTNWTVLSNCLSISKPTTTIKAYLEVLKIENIFMENFPNIMTKNGIGKHLVDILPKFSASSCKQFPGEYLLQLFVRMRIYYVVKSGNQDLRKAKKGKNKKFFKVTYL
jgi:hypothetical protein